MTFVVDAEDADVMGDEPIWQDGKVVGWVTSGGYAHHVDRSLAQGYLPRELAENGAGGFEIEILGERRGASIQKEPLFDPEGAADAGLTKSPQMNWLNEPPDWREADGILSVTTGERTDFWRETHYGFIRDTGHFRYREASGDFTATLAFHGDYAALYDQAGMMLRVDERNWIKAGIEFVGGQKMLSVVVTRDFSDWSTMPLPTEVHWLALRCSREKSAVRIEWAPAESADFKMLRLAYLPPRDPIFVGPMCCSPERASFEAKFRNFEAGPLLARGLHD